jgi:outer membrane receptor protein involved in Fe transport
MTRKYAAAGACLAAVLALAIAPRSLAQTAPATPAATAATTDQTEEVVKLNPFVVEAEGQSTYRADSTLAGTRVKTDLKDIASSISVVTSQFLQDTGATNNQTLLQYTTNTEVGGVYGNYAGVGGTFINGANENSNFVHPDGNTRVRGLDSADNARDYFQTDIPWDSYIVDRVDLQRGPNSILFGIGSPAGIINASINTAGFKDAFKIESRLGSFGTNRNSVDFNHVLIKDQLSIRIVALNDNTKYHENPAYSHDKRLFGAVRWEPELFKGEGNHTSVRANFEHGKVNSNNPRVLPPEDHITPWFDPNAINRTTVDPYFAWAGGIVPYSGNTVAGIQKNYWLVQYQGNGLQQSGNPQFFYDNTGLNGGTPMAAREASVSTAFAIDSNGNIPGGIGGIPYGSPVGIGSFYDFATDLNRYNPTQMPAADKGFYKARTLTDPGASACLRL